MIPHLERCLLVENVVDHACTYACSQCGFEPAPTSSRNSGYDPPAALRSVERALRQLEQDDRTVDHLAVAGAGEPTLDRNLGVLLQGLRASSLPIVVHTNGSTLHRDDVRRELAGADAVCIAVDTVDAKAFERMHRPPRERSFELGLGGVRIFPSTYGGTILTETTLRLGVNTNVAQLEETADFIASLKPAICYLRQHSDETPSAPRMERARAIFAQRVPRVELGEPHGRALARVQLSAALRYTRRPVRERGVSATA